jgi:hypothetical protein
LNSLLARLESIGRNIVVSETRNYATDGTTD